MAEEKKPNVLLITADQMRYDALACNGHPTVQTPNFDLLANAGVRFCNSFSCNPICVPARAAITTGRYPHKCTGIKNNSGLIRDGQAKIAEHFRACGYSTYALGKLHYLPYARPDEPRRLHGFEHAELCEEGRILRQYDPHGERRGLEDYHDYLHEVGWGGYERAHGIGNNDVHPSRAPVPAEHHVDQWVATRTIDVLKRHRTENPGKPFFTWMSFVKPHAPYDPPAPYDSMYDPRQVPPPMGGPQDQAGRAPLLRDMYTRYAWERLSPETVQNARAHYMGLVSFQDHCLGQVLGFLDSNGLRENTIILYTADHGDLVGDFGCFFKCTFYNGSVRVPFLISAPGLLPQGVTRHAFIGSQDVLPTLASLAGVPVQGDIDGADMTEVMTGDAAGRDLFVSECLDDPWQSYMLFDGRRKYIYNQANGVEELYDVESDPQELNNIAGKSQTEVREYRERLIAWCRDQGDLKMLDGDGLKRTPVDESQFGFQVDRMGWRWY